MSSKSARKVRAIILTLILAITSNMAISLATQKGLSPNPIQPVKPFLKGLSPNPIQPVKPVFRGLSPNPIQPVKP